MLSLACDLVECNFYAECVDNGQGLTTCECPSSCDGFSTQHICGNNSKTYSNECEMRKTSCQQERLIRKGYDGNCGKSRFTSFKYTSCTAALSQFSRFSND